jgi:hypothetical protein
LSGVSGGEDSPPGGIGDSAERAASADGARPAGGSGRAPRADSAHERPARVVFALLVLACFVALVVTQRLKHTPTPVQSFEMTPSFSPSGAGLRSEERISFKLAKADEVTVTVINTAGDDVATLVRDLPTPRYRQLSLRWNGRLGEAHGYTVLRSPDGHTSLLPANRGAPAPFGEYSVRVSLRHQDRSVPSPRTFKLVAP